MKIKANNFCKKWKFPPSTFLPIFNVVLILKGGEGVLRSDVVYYHNKELKEELETYHFMWQKNLINKLLTMC